MTAPGHLPPEPTFGPVIITAREIYDAIVRVSAKVDAIGIQMTQLATDTADLEQRVRSLERARWPLPSIAVLTSVAAVVVAFMVR